MASGRKAYLVGGGIGSLAAAAFLIRDGGLKGSDITVYEMLPILGGSRILLRHGEAAEAIDVGPEDLVFFQNGSMTDASSLGSMTSAPPHRTKHDSGGYTRWSFIFQSPCSSVHLPSSCSDYGAATVTCSTLLT